MRQPFLAWVQRQAPARNGLRRIFNTLKEYRSRQRRAAPRVRRVAGCAGQQGGRPGMAGYTIFEVMIVLAVTSVLFVSATAIFSGRQSKTQFSQAMYDLQSQIQTYANEVSTGTFPGTSGYKCSTGPAPNRRPQLTASATGQSTSQDCLLIGRVIQAVQDSSSIYTYTVLGLREALDASGADTGQPATTLADASPEVAMNPSHTDYLFMDTYNLLQGLKIVSSKYYTAAATSQPAELLQLYTTFQNNSSNSQAMTAYTIPGVGSSDIGEPSGTSVDPALKKCIELQSPCDNPTMVGVFGWKLCVQDSGLADRKAELTVRSAASGITTNLDMTGCSS